MGRPLAMLMVAIAIMCGGLPAPVAAQEADETLDYATGERSDWDQWWFENVVLLERAAAAATSDDEQADPGLDSTSCPNESWATYVVYGSTGDDVMIYGHICTGTPSICASVGWGVCRYTLGSSYPPCQVGTFQSRTLWPSYAGYPLGIHGDPNGGGYGADRIYPASCYSGGLIACGSGYYIGMGGLASDARFEICGDDCSISYGSSDQMTGWNNRDIIYAGPGTNEYLSGGGGSDCLWGDNGRDIIQGGDCTVGTTEELWGGLGDDVLAGYAILNQNGGTACSRLFRAGDGTDDIYGGPGADALWGEGGAEDDLYGGNGNDTLRGGSGELDLCDGEAPTTSPGDSCETSSSSCDDPVGCESTF